MSVFYQFLQYIGISTPGFLASTLLRLVLALFFGGFIGVEREHNHHPAGLRTHALVCLGAALVMVLSEYICNLYGTTDPTRMGAQVISGIGFLGAGTIIKEGFSVRGLTTAATLWAVSCIGLAVGAGFLMGGFLATVLVYVTLFTVKRLVTEHNKNVTITVVVKPGGDTAERITRLLEQNSCPVESVLYRAIKVVNQQEVLFRISITNTKAEISMILSELQRVDGVISVAYGKGETLI